jgi:hypothetical protein
MTKKQLAIFIGGMLSVVLLLAWWYVQTVHISSPLPAQQPTYSSSDIPADLEKLSEVEPDFASIRAFFVTLSKEKGGVYAFEVLKQAVTPPNIDMHLLGHAIGEEIYTQHGLDGMQYCTHDFRNACSHSVVIGALLAEGPEVFDKVNDACRKAPGGSGAYTMCFHGFGHGVLAYADYEVPEAVKLCGKVGTPEYNDEEEAQCIGGIVMEMFQGVHDLEVWQQKKDKYLSTTDPLRMCMSDYMPESAKVLCYSYITPFIFDAAGANGGNPTPDMYPKSFAFCDAVKDDRQRQSCYGGLGKEFVVFAQDRDIRKMEDTPNDRLKLSASWCALAEKQEAKQACLLSILDSLYWGGENDPEVSVRYCSLLEEGEDKNNCFSHLFGIASYYQKDPQVYKELCRVVPESFVAQCEAQKP